MKPSTATFTLTIGAHRLTTVTRFVELTHTAGKLPTIDIRRETHEGRPCGAVRIFADAFPALDSALEATVRGEVGLVFEAPTRSGCMAFATTRRGGLTVGMQGHDGQPRGLPSDLHQSEVQSLRESLRIATGGEP